MADGVPLRIWSSRRVTVTDLAPTGRAEVSVREQTHLNCRRPASSPLEAAPTYRGT